MPRLRPQVIYRMMYTKQAGQVAIWMAVEAFDQSRAWADDFRATLGGAAEGPRVDTTYQADNIPVPSRRSLQRKLRWWTRMGSMDAAVGQESRTRDHRRTK